MGKSIKTGEARPSGARVRGAQAHPRASRARVPDLIIVQDDPLFLEFLEYLFAARGYRVRSFHDGSEARDWLDAARPGPSAPVVLLDPEIPGLSAFDLLEVRGLYGTGQFRFVILSVEGSEEAQVRSLRLGALDYLVKPVRLPILRAKLENFLGPAPS